jgi:hypothetical protein
MAACYWIRLAALPLCAHAPQSNANANSLAGASAYSYGPRVLKGQNVRNIVCARLAAIHSRQDPAIGIVGSERRIADPVVGNSYFKHRAKSSPCSAPDVKEPGGGRDWDLRNSGTSGLLTTELSGRRRSKLMSLLLSHSGPTSDRRRSQRVHLRIPIAVIAPDGHEKMAREQTHRWWLTATAH